MSNNDIQNFEITLCIGNKVDLLPDHPVHAEYRRRIQKLGADSDDLFTELIECGISETEGSSLLGDEKPSWEIRNSCFEWCAMHNIEYVEACASSADFDKCKPHAYTFSPKIFINMYSITCSLVGILVKD